MYTKTWRDRVASGLLWLAALSAFGAFLGSIPSVLTASPDVQVVEAWRLFGFVVFTGVFSLLAWHPQRYVGVWEVVILHKFAMAVTGIMLMQTHARDAASVALIDGILTLLLLVAYVLARGYTLWQNQSRLPMM